MRRRESGSALIITVLVMLLLGAIGISALDTVMRDQQVAGYQNRSSTAFYAAEAGVAAAKDLVRRNVLSGNERLSFADRRPPFRKDAPAQESEGPENESHQEHEKAGGAAGHRGTCI